MRIIYKGTMKKARPLLVNFEEKTGHKKRFNAFLDFIEKKLPLVNICDFSGDIALPESLFTEVQASECSYLEPKVKIEDQSDGTILIIIERLPKGITYQQVLQTLVADVNPKFGPADPVTKKSKCLEDDAQVILLPKQTVFKDQPSLEYNTFSCYLNEELLKMDYIFWGKQAIIYIKAYKRWRKAYKFAISLSLEISDQINFSFSGSRFSKPFDIIFEPRSNQKAIGEKLRTVEENYYLMEYRKKTTKKLESSIINTDKIQFVSKEEAIKFGFKFYCEDGCGRLFKDLPSNKPPIYCGCGAIHIRDIFTEQDIVVHGDYKYISSV